MTFWEAFDQSILVKALSITLVIELVLMAILLVMLWRLRRR